ncbi:hypothetical protein [Cellulomonas sp. S1-8]|uniref:hypothetical protein n=1 Tax=Cellulomonas sp. S1-8 TaxID=2904790 RepID=UPI0022445646|nr:hypothetical protein [Cellulomonas sp. S1-8]UZN02969.1 hypothetical protein OKX07_18250 [Cellulomonas sp. S1-8]
MDPARARKVKVGLAGLAVLGLGAALTSAQWTDQVFFQADVATGVFNIQGAVPDDPTAPALPADPEWLESATWGPPQDATTVAALELDLGTLQIAPDETVTFTGYVRNDPTSTWTADVTDLTVAGDFLPDGITAGTPEYADPIGAAELDPGAVATFTVDVTAGPAEVTPGDGGVVQGAAGSIVVLVNGESVAPFVGIP